MQTKLSTLQAAFDAGNFKKAVAIFNIILY
jgi:hypothetical protein